MDQEANLSQIRKMLFRCDARGIERTPAGAQFICPVPKHGPLAFLHSLYKPCDSGDLAEIEELFGYALPIEYIAFMKSNNGASLFVGAISIHGWGKVLSRSLLLEDQAAIFLDSTHQTHRLLEPADWSQGWRPIGNLVAKNRHPLAVNSYGTFRLRSASGTKRLWTSFTLMLADCIIAADACFDCDGIGEGGYIRLEEAFDALAASRN